MYIDLIVFVLIIIAVVAFYRSFSSFVYLVISLDILYRLLHFIADNVKIPELTSLIDKYVPKDIVSMISNYIGTKGIFYTILMWAMFALYCIFLSYLIKNLVKRTI